MTEENMHKQQIVPLNKIEGQIKGLKKMIEDDRYCVDIINQIQSVIGALARVQQEIFKKHLEGCVADTFNGQSEKEKMKKTQEIIELVSKLKK